MKNRLLCILSVVTIAGCSGSPQPAADHRPHRPRQGEVDRRVRTRPPGLEPGLAGRGVPVREVRQMADRRGERPQGARRAARRHRAGRSGRLAQDG